MLKIVFVLFLSAGAVYAADEKVDWALCSAEIKEHCSESKDDHAKHECLEKIDQTKLSKKCKNKNHELEKKFSKEHKADKHSH